MSGYFCMGNKRKKGFTLVELTVVLVILGIIAAIAVPFFINYWKKAEFRKNQENAKTVYLAAESRLTYYRSSGQWDKFKKEILKAAKDGTLADEASFEDGSDSELNGRIYTIKLDKSAKDQTTKNNLVLEILDDYTYDKDFFNASISIEIDIESGEVYSAFYGSRCKGLNYKSDDTDGYLTMQKRDYDSRRDRLLGYYSTEDTVNSVNLEAKRLRITTINLVNSEKLYLNWSSNAGADLGVDYDISFYNKKGDQELFSVRVSQMDMRSAGWSTTDTASSMASLTVKDGKGKDQGTWQFPVTYSDNKFSLILDAMMSAKVEATLDSQANSSSASSDLLKTSSISITRLSSVASALSDPQTIYAKVKATAYSGSLKHTSTVEYRDSETVKSNTANSMFGDDTEISDKNKKVTVTAFRHLSNIRYYENNKKDTKKSDTTFSLTNKNMDWASAGTGVYDFKTEKTKTGESLQKLTWRENTSEKTVGFPAIPDLSGKYILEGKGSDTLISNLYLNEESVVVDETAKALKKDATQYLGLFGEIEGTVKKVTFKDPILTIGTSKTSSLGSLNSLRGVGILAGRSEGSLKDVSLTVTSSKKNQTVLNADLSKDTSRYVCVGSLVGALAKISGNDVLNSPTSGGVYNLQAEGKMEVTLPEEDEIKDISEVSGVGGIVGYAKLDKSVKKSNVQISDCESNMEISANRYAGGIVGRVDSDLAASEYENASALKLQELANVIDCQSESLVRCTSSDKDSETAEGNYFGGIVGYAEDALLYNVSSASGRGDSFSYSDHVAEKDQYLLGDYVGGIAGYAQDTLLANCSTQKNGYVLGNDYVGGIAGGLGGSITEAIQTVTDEGDSATVNASYVIGNKYVGGITGINQKDVTLKNCINNGVAAAYEKYVGGVVGYNAEKSKIQDCVSYLSDYDDSIFNMITDTWNAKADYAGGIAGYNNGAIKFSADSKAVTVKSVSSIVVGQNYVGGIAGFNDVEGSLDVEYTLIGGKIYAYGNCAGGLFGLNASEEILEKELSIKPSSLQGNYCVGGCIGANVVALTNDVTMGGIKTDNSLGQISGNAFCGGVIGYARTYTSSQLSQSTLLATLENSSDELLPSIDADGIPTAVRQSDNSYTLTISTNNNIPIRGGIYVGGIVGYCEKNTNLLMKDCTNSGDLSLKDTQYSDGVVLGNFQRSSEISLTDANVEERANEVYMHFAGGIISVNLENQVIDDCKNTATMSGFDGVGGIVGLNAGLITNCNLNQHFGNTALNYVGGIAGVNLGTGVNKTYNGTSYTAGTIEKCSTLKNKTLSGNSNVGGIVGWNMSGGLLKDNTSNCNVTGAGEEAIGGLAGRNSGSIKVTTDENKAAKTISGSNATGVGGIVGVNEEAGALLVEDNLGTQVVAVGNQTSVEGSKKVGGIIGINEGSFGDQNRQVYIRCEAKSIRASNGYAGGLVGETGGDIFCGINASTTVTADQGYAGGITAYNKKTIASCNNYGNVTSSNGYAGGIAAENVGVIEKCLVEGQNNSNIKIYSVGVSEAGAVVAVNGVMGTIEDSKPGKNVSLGESASIYGGVAGLNKGTIQKSEDFEIKEIPTITTIQGGLTVGGAVGVNEANAKIIGVTVSSDSSNKTMNGFTGYKYLGGLVGDNYGQVEASSFTGNIKESSGTVGNCYGGIAGINEGGASIKDCSIDYISMSIQGVYSATSTNSASQKENLSTHAGGIVGKNEEEANVSGCTLEDNKNSVLVAKYGMLGGVAGFNKGNISGSGSSITAKVMEDAETLDQLVANAKKQGLDADSNYVAYNGKAQLEDLKYSNSNKSVSSSRLKMYMDTNGNIGGITAYNSTTGAVSECVSGDWFLSNKSAQVGVGTGGIIGMNESEKDTSKVVNGAFVGRYIANEETNRFAGGIIGNQNNSTSKDWTINMAVNFGTIYCFNSHYSGGIVGQWTGSGGTIQNSRNYGMLQTTFAEGWRGASGGIVAQLYHASDNHEYNIIGCDNYGSIYKRNGSNGNGANDSAGILGNVTTYQGSSSQNFTIRILDCMNGPGVKIYSNSMASGIFGFMSCDNPSAYNIQTSTKQVNIQIERCRNFASEMVGSSFTGGIVGARYGGWDHTTVKDCYSPNFGGYGIFSNGINSGDEAWSNNPSGTYKNLFVYDGQKSRGFYGNTGFTLGSKDSDGNITRGSGSITLTKAYLSKFSEICSSVDLLKKQDGKYVVVKMNSDVWWMSGFWCYIDADNYIRNGNEGDKIIGQVLYEVNEDYSSSNQIKNTAVVKTDPEENTLAYNARGSYRRIEGIVTKEDGTCLILAPTGATAEIKDGKLSISITPNTMNNADNGSSEDASTYCDPFKYRITVSNGSESESFDLYEESGSFDLPDNLTGNVSVAVQAISMFDDVEDSDPYEVKDLTIHGVLPEPDVKLVIVSHEGGDRYKAIYQAVLNNLEDYTAKDENGDELYPGWQVTVNIVGAGTITINKDNPTPTWSYTFGGNIEAASKTFQMISKASISGGSGEWEDSKEVTTSVRLCNNYRPPRALKNWSPLTQTVTVTGTSLSDLAVKIELDAGNTATDVPPIYRAELVGDWKGEKEVVFEEEDILLVSQGKASATFSNLPEAIKDATNLKVRLWFAASGEGPVYTYYELDTKDNANVKELVSVAEDGTPTYKCLHSTPLENYDNYYDNYINRLDTGISWLPAPVLEGADSDTYKAVESYGDDGEIYYKFSWDQGVSGTDNASYQVSMTGIDKNGKEVRIASSDVYKGGKSLTIDGSKWNYSQVKLTVTRIGDSSSKKIGLSTTGTYKMKQRLTKPAQPSLSLISQNELLYKLSWNALSSEEGVEGYQAYIQVYGSNDKLEKEEKLGELITTDQKDGKAYKQELDLENYAGKRVVIYLVAKADKDSAYLDSEAGITYELTIPERIKTPTVAWSIDWKYDQEKYLEADAFEEGGLTVSLKADKNSIPPGGSAYLLKAYVYDSEEEAGKATDSDPGTNYKVKYPLEESVTQMDVNSSTDYSHSLSGLSTEYAGKWIVFYGRISSGAGSVSSKWVKSKVYRLPYVKLKAPEIRSDVEEGVSFTANVQSTPEVPGQDETWTGKRTYLTWESVFCASAYEVNLNGLVTGVASSGEKTGIGSKLRLIEGSDGVAVWVWRAVEEKVSDTETKIVWKWVTVEETAQDIPEGTAETDILHTFDIPDYGVTATGTYIAADGSTPVYTVTLSSQLVVQKTEDGTYKYSLKLPDVTEMKAADGSVVTNDDFGISAVVKAYSNVSENVEDVEKEEAEEKSEAYVRSEECTIEW